MNTALPERKGMRAERAYRAHKQFLTRQRLLLRLYIRGLCLRHSFSMSKPFKGMHSGKIRRFKRWLWWMQEKVCAQCLTTKTRKDFSADVTRDDGLTPRCKECASDNTHQWVEKPGNREKTRIWSGEQRQRNQGNEAVRDYHRRYAKMWDQNNRDKRHIYDRRSRLKRQQAPIIETVDVQVLYKRDKGICSLCLKRVDKRLQFPHPMSPTVDHIIPLSRGGEESYANTALAHLHCNVRKNNRNATQQMRLF